MESGAFRAFQTPKRGVPDRGALPPSRPPSRPPSHSSLSPPPFCNVISPAVQAADSAIVWQEVLLNVQ